MGSLSQEVKAAFTERISPVIINVLISDQALIERIQQLSAHNNQLRNTIKKTFNHQVDDGETKRKGRAFDFSK